MCSPFETKNGPSCRTSLLVTCTFLLVALNLPAQERQAPSWITHPDISGHGYGVYNFRKTIELQATPEHFNVHVSADNRYRLYVNGVSVAAGPQRSDVMHWRYEEVDLAPWEGGLSPDAAPPSLPEVPDLVGVEGGGCHCGAVLRPAEEKVTSVNSVLRLLWR